MLRIEVRYLASSNLGLHDNFEFVHGGPVKIGRHPSAEQGVTPIEPKIMDPSVSRNHAVVTQTASGRIHVKNISSNRVVTVLHPASSTIDCGMGVELDSPTTLQLGATEIRVAIEKEQRKQKREREAETEGRKQETPQPRGEIYRTIRRSIEADLHLDEDADTSDSIDGVPSVERLMTWLELLGNVLRSAAGTNAFYLQAAQAVVERCELDAGAVVMFVDGKPRIVAECPVDTTRSLRLSRRILEMAVESKTTRYHNADEMDSKQSLADTEAVVASPIFNATDDVIGVVYGVRYSGGTGKPQNISPIEARMVHLLASIVSTGAARQSREEEATRNRVLLEQVCSAEVAAELENDPRWLDTGIQREVTVMFCDLRNFTDLADALDSQIIFELLQDLMNTFSEEIITHKGMIIDYYGDGVAAMWNAPKLLEDHANRACDAARTIVNRMSELNARWEQRIGRQLQAGIGIHCGMAHVGNAGSRQRVKYGPRGDTVNMASRIEGATKEFGVPILISESVKEKLTPEFMTRRIFNVELKGIREPLNVYELCCDAADADWIARRDTYEEALQLYESRKWNEAFYMLNSRPDDPVVEKDLAWKILLERNSQFDPVYRFRHK